MSLSAESKIEFFNEMKRRIVYDSREPCAAIRYDHAISDCSEYWYLVDAEDGKGYTVQAVHDIVPLSKLKDETPYVEKKQGAFSVIGKTYEIEPFYLGNKHSTVEDDMEIEFMQRLILKRENYKIFMFQKAIENLVDPNEEDITGYRDRYIEYEKLRPSILEVIEKTMSLGVDMMTDKEYDMMVNRKVQRTESNITYKQAQKRASVFWAADPACDKALIDDNAYASNAQNVLLNKLNFDNLIP